MSDQAPSTDQVLPRAEIPRRPLKHPQALLAISGVMFCANGLMTWHLGGEIDEWILAICVVTAISSGLVNIAPKLTGANVTFDPSGTVLRLAVFATQGYGILAMTVLGPLATWVKERYRWQVAIFNSAKMGFAYLVALEVFVALLPEDASDSEKVLLFLVVPLVDMTLDVSFWALSQIADYGLDDIAGRREQLIAFRPILAPLGVEALVSVVVIALYAAYGLVVGVLAVAASGLLLMFASLVFRATNRAEQLVVVNDQLLKSLVRALTLRDPNAYAHGIGVAGYCIDLAAELDLPDHERELVQMAGLLHDVGRLGLSDRVLTDARDEMTEEDWEAVQRHPIIGDELLAEVTLGPLSKIVRHHHERYDGRGYPDQLAGEDIPLLSRIVGICEAYDTMTADDSYKAQMTRFEALQELQAGAGTQFDPDLVEVFGRVMARNPGQYRRTADAPLSVNDLLERYAPE